MDRQSILKTAATRQVKIIRQLMREGKTHEAERLIERLHLAGVLKVSGPGTNIKRLGSGAEAIADVTIGAKAKPHLMTVRKAFDPKGPLYSKEGLGEKVDAYRRARSMGLEDDYAKLYGKLGKGEKGGRYLHTEYVPDSIPVRYGDGGLKKSLSGGLRDENRKAEMAQKAGVDITPEGILAARAAKREPIIQHLRRQGVKKEEAERRALEAIPKRGGPKQGDLHTENVRDVDGLVKILDFTPTPAHRLDALDAAVKGYKTQWTPQLPLGRKKQLIAREWSARAGVQPTAEAIGNRSVREPWGAYVRETPAGLSSGPKTGREATERALKGLGGGSRQAKKVRGERPPMAGRIRSEKAPERAGGKVIPFAAAAGLGGLGLLGTGAYLKNKELKKAASAAFFDELDKIATHNHELLKEADVASVLRQSSVARFLRRAARGFPKPGTKLTPEQQAKMREMTEFGKAPERTGFASKQKAWRKELADQPLHTEMTGAKGSAAEEVAKKLSRKKYELSLERMGAVHKAKGGKEALEKRIAQAPGHPREITRTPAKVVAKGTMAATPKAVANRELGTARTAVQTGLSRQNPLGYERTAIAV